MSLSVASHSPIYSSGDEGEEQQTKEEKITIRLAKLHVSQQNKRKTKQIKNKQFEIYKLQFKETNIIYDIFELLIEDGIQIIYTIDNLSEHFDYSIVYQGVVFIPDYFKPNIKVRKLEGSFAADISYSKAITTRVGWNKAYYSGRQPYYRLSTLYPQFSSNFFDDFKIVYLFFIFDVLEALRCKIQYPDSPVYAQKFKAKRYYDNDAPYGSHFLIATVNYFKKHECDTNEIIEAHSCNDEYESNFLLSFFNDDC